MRMSIIADVSQIKSTNTDGFSHDVKRLFNAMWQKYDLPDHFMHHRQRNKEGTERGLTFIQWEMEYDKDTVVASDDITHFANAIFKLQQHYIKDSRLIMEVNKTIVNINQELMEDDRINEVISKAIQQGSLYPNQKWII